MGDNRFDDLEFNTEPGEIDLPLEELARAAMKGHQQDIGAAHRVWMEGNIKDYWKDENGYLCVRYESGNWWHYSDLDMPFITYWKGDAIRLFVDMDGTLAEFKQVDTLETLYEEGYFLNLKPQENVLEAVRMLCLEENDIEVFIMSSVMADSKYALDEKNRWLDRYLPELDASHRIFPNCGENKLDYIPGSPGKRDILLDDYTKNLVEWEPPCIGIKILNGINHTHGSWKGRKVDYSLSPEILSGQIKKQILSSVCRRTGNPIPQRCR